MVSMERQLSRSLFWLLSSDEQMCLRAVEMHSKQQEVLSWKFMYVSLLYLIFILEDGMLESFHIWADFFPEVENFPDMIAVSVRAVGCQMHPFYPLSGRNAQT